MNSAPNGLAIAWAQYGPYHFARIDALRRVALHVPVHALEFANITQNYSWDRGPAKSDLVTLCPGRVTESLSFGNVFLKMRQALAEMRINVCFLPSYSPMPSMAAFFAAKSMGIRTVMMNDSHVGTARARGMAMIIKRQLACLFDSALVAGQPHKRYFASLGFPEGKIFTGYDAVDNGYFAAKARDCKSRSAELRHQYGLPTHYFLSLGRFVEKKNLPVLIRAFRRFLDATRFRNTHLVLVGSGEEEHKLKALCRGFGLPVYEKQQAPEQDIQIANRKSQIANDPGVHFYGFRQIAENPVFYALADAFILPSLWEEWGLVVNEAMASSLPVVVSETAGCAEDLLQSVQSTQLFSTQVQSQIEELRLGRQIRENGFVFNPESSDELSRVLEFLGSCSETRAAMGQASRHIVEKVSCENFAKNALLAAEAALGLKSSLAAERGPEVAMARAQ